MIPNTYVVCSCVDHNYYNLYRLDESYVNITVVVVVSMAIVYLVAIGVLI